MDEIDSCRGRGRFFLALLAVDEVIDHPALNGAGAIERVERGQVFEPRRLIAPQDISHAVRLKLEDRRGIRARKELIGGRVVERQRLQIDCGAAIGGNQLHGIGKNRKGGQPEEIHLQQAQPLEALHVILRGDFVAIGLVNGQQFGERLRRDHYPGRVRRSVPRQALQALGHFEQILEALVAVDGRAKLARLLQRFFERNIDLVGNKLGELIDVTIRQVERPAHIFESGLGGHGSEGNDLRDVLAAVFLRDVIDHFAAPPHAEIDVDVGHGNAFRIQEAFEKQIVLQRVDVGNFQRETDEAPRRRSSARPHRNALRARIAHEVPDDQEIAGVAHLHDHLDFVREALFVFGQRTPQPALFRELF